jgi:hypothetical protein
MTATEYIQMRAFARVDGLKLFALWIVSFVCYVAGFTKPMLGMLALLLAFFTPFLVTRLLKKFRDNGLDGIISFGRGWGYVVFLFFYASLLFAACQFVYFNYMDKGYFMTALVDMFNDAETSQAMRQLGMGDAMTQSMEQLKAMRPIDLVLNIMTSNLMLGCILAIPIAALCKHK